VGSVAEAAAFHLSGLYQRMRGRRPSDLALDPVCHMLVDPATAAATRRYEAEELCFCSSRCARRFDDDPAAYPARRARVAQ
jgi:YHS domain-containing protein